ncbi:MAG: hypothetical protein IH840_02515 [Candidatus Heimdallarchaeota archaeon]|nr:hypothetical protein [Candidatus Heimdallarchaeota archaeon]
MSNIIDFHQFYRVYSGTLYGIFVLMSITNLRPNSNPILPNLFILITFIILTFLISTTGQILEPTTFKRTQLLRKLLASLIPPFLGILIAYRFIKEERRNRNEPALIFGGLMIIVTFSVLSIFYVGLLILLYVFAESTTIGLYLILLGPLSLLGILMAESNVLYTSHLSLLPNEEKRSSQRFREITSKYLIKLSFTRTRRLVSIILITFIFTITMILSLRSQFGPVYV